MLESLALTPEIKERMRTLAGKNTDLHKRTRLYLDIVVSGLPFLPHGPKSHPQTALNARADDLSRIVKTLHKVERDLFHVPESPIDLRDWVQ